MTAIVGILCKDGVVIGADGSTTFTTGQFRTIEQPSHKIDVIKSRVILAGTGAVGLGQRFCAVIDRAWEGREFRKAPLEIVTKLCADAVGNFKSTDAKPGLYGALVAFPQGDKYEKFGLCEFETNNFQPELKVGDRIWYSSMGSAQMITDPFLGFIREVFWKDGQPSTQGGIFAATWTLDHAVSLNAGGVRDPISLAVLEQSPRGFEARLLSNEELDGHRQTVDAAKQHLRDFPRLLRSESAPEVPKPKEAAGAPRAAVTPQQERQPPSS